MMQQAFKLHKIQFLILSLCVCLCGIWRAVFSYLIILFTYLFNEDDRDKDKLAIAFNLGNCGAIGSVFHHRRLFELLDPSILALQMGVREDSQNTSWVHGAHWVCGTICSLGRDSDPWHSVVYGARMHPRAYDHLLAVDCFKADWSHWDSQWVMHFLDFLLMLWFYVVQWDSPDFIICL